MKEKILKLLREKRVILTTEQLHNQVAEDIMELFKKFICWLEYEEDDFVCEWKDVYVRISTGDNYTLDEVFEYWLKLKKI